MWQPNPHPFNFRFLHESIKPKSIFFYKERKKKDSGKQHPNTFSSMVVWLEQSVEVQNKYMSEERVNRGGEDAKR